MAEVTRVLREMQFDNEGGLVPASGSVPLCSRRRTKLVVKDDSAAVRATKAVAGNKAVGGLIGVTKAGMGKEEAIGKVMTKASSWSDFGIYSTNLAGKAPEEALAVVMPNKPEEEKAAVVMPNKPAPEEEEKAGAVVMPNNPAPEEEKLGAVSVVMPTKMAPEEEDKLDAVPVFVVIPAPKDEKPVLTERVPESFIAGMKRRPFTRARPLTAEEEDLFSDDPRYMEERLKFKTLKDDLVDFQENILLQEKLRGYAEVAVSYTTDGIKRIFAHPDILQQILPQ